jgi:feruloyl esterase
MCRPRRNDLHPPTLPTRIHVEVLLMHRTAGLLAMVMTCAAVPAMAQAPAPGPQECAALRNLQLPGVAISEVTAEWIPAARSASGAPAALPAHCRLQAMLERRTGVDGQQYGIGFAVSLPAAWNRRFLFQGGSAFNGVVNPPVGRFPGSITEINGLARGFAIASTDSGHRSSNPFDGTFFGDQQATLDFAYRAIERVTAVAKVIIAQHYAQPVLRSYYAGCSTGGREAMQAAQRYPMEFDGVISGAPAMRTNYSVLGTDWINAQLSQVAPRGADGRPVTRDALSSAQKQAVIEGIRSACDANDGVRDGLVFNTSSCRFDPATLVCGGKNSGAGCLTAAQAEALRRAFAGPRSNDGRPLYPPFPFDTGIADTQGIPGLLHGGLNTSGASMTDVNAAVRRADNDGPATLINTANWTNLTTFVNRGGKMLLFHGVSDPGFSALDTVGYYNRLAAANGGADAVRQWARLFLIPGMGHCQGGSLTTDAYDSLTALADWVEHGVAPDAVIAARPGEPSLTRPLCAYPHYAHYSGRGDPTSASRFECRAP